MVDLSHCFTVKQVCLNEGEDSPKSSESSESSSSEETATHGRSSQEPLQPDTPDAMGENPLDAAPLPSADAGPSLAMPDPEDPQTSADALQLLPDDPSHTAMSVDIALNVPDSNPDPTKDSLTAETMSNIPPDTDTPHPPALSETGVIAGTNQPQVIATYQGSLQGVTPSFPTCVIQPTPMSFSTASPLVVPTGTALNGGPVCFTIQVTTPERDPPRGDSI